MRSGTGVTLAGYRGRGKREAAIGDDPAAVGLPAGLAERLSARDPAAFAAFYDACSRRAFGLACRIAGDGQAAEDIVHDAFLWFWEHADRVDPGRGAPESLLLTITHRRAIDYVRKRQRNNGRRAPQETQWGIIDEEAMALLDAVGDTAVRERMLAGVAALNADQREAIELAYFAGMTHEQIARARAVPLGTVKSRLRLGLAKLRAALQGEA